ncbi:MAG: hypothetical protein HC905_18005 [Bacteroidales bacterium]|nr:hypothetical protein [Bacteroidales bacterium]
MQVATPNFETIEKIIVDTTLSATNFKFNLYPGKFQWRIRPQNGSSKGNYRVYSMEIDTTLDLRGQEVMLKVPSENIAVNTTSLKFSWKNSIMHQIIVLKSGLVTGMAEG